MPSPSFPLSSFLSLLALAGRGLAAALAQEILDTLTVTNIEDVRGNLHLPSQADGFNLTWSSSNDQIIAPDGIVSRQDADAEVVLTVTIEDSGETYEREFSASVRRKAQLDAFEAYAFSYFTGSSLEGENIYFAASRGNNALDWQELNGGKPVLRSSQGTRGLRDPFIIRSPEGDTFYMIATDLSIGSGTSWGDAVRRGSLYLEVWESNDLVNWSEQRHIQVSPPNAGNTWAPEAFWDSASGSYAVFWASSLYADDDPNHDGNSYHRMMYALTRDFVTFGEPQVWQDAGDARIDSTVIKVDDTYYRFTKDEGSATGCTDIIQEKSTSLLAPLSGWTIQASCIAKEAGLKAVEGPTAFKSNPGDVNGEKYYLFVDEYVDRGFIPLATQDPGNPDWTVPASYNLPRSPRHGTVIPVTKAEHAALVSSLSTRKKGRRTAISKRQDTPVISGVSLSDARALKVEPIVSS